jgi:hypothetical protein
MGDHVRVGELDIWTEQVGEGSDVLLIGGLRDTVESWQFQLDGLADRYRLPSTTGARTELRCPTARSRWRAADHRERAGSRNVGAEGRP